MPSPVCFTSRPRDATSARRMIRSCSVSRTMNAASPCSSSSAVEPSRSVKRMVRNGLVPSALSAGSLILPRKRRTLSSATLMISFGIMPCASLWSATRSSALGALARQKTSARSMSNQYASSCTPYFAAGMRSSAWASATCSGVTPGRSCRSMNIGMCRPQMRLPVPSLLRPCEISAPPTRRYGSCPNSPRAGPRPPRPRAPPSSASCRS